MTAARLLDIGRTLHARIKVFFDAPLDATASPLEIAHAIIEQLEGKVTPLGRGERIFPYNRVLVRIAPPMAGVAALQAALGRLGDKFLTRLAELGCPAPVDFQLQVTHLEHAPDDWSAGQLFTIECRNEASAPLPSAAAATAPRRVIITILTGAAARQTYSFEQREIAIGRTAEPTDERGRVRRNDVVFLDVADGVTETVGRAHARLQLDAAACSYRLLNESSGNPTFIVRAGRTIQVPARDPRGVRVQPADVIHLGRASIRLAFDR